MTTRERSMVLDDETGALQYDSMPVFVIPRELMVGAAEEMVNGLLSFTGKGMLGIYRIFSRKVGQKIFQIHLPPEAEGKSGEDMVNAVFDRFVVSGWGRYAYERTADGKYTVSVRHFWLGEALKGVDKKPLCSMMEGVLGSLFTRAFGKDAKVTETQCVALGDPIDAFEVQLG